MAVATIVAFLTVAACSGDDGGAGPSETSTTRAATYLLDGERCEQEGAGPNARGAPGDARWLARLTNTSPRRVTFVVTIDFVRQANGDRVASRSQTVPGLAAGATAELDIVAGWRNDGRYDAAGSLLDCELRSVESSPA